MLLFILSMSNCVMPFPSLVLNLKFHHNHINLGMQSLFQCFLVARQYSPYKLYDNLMYSIEMILPSKLIIQRDDCGHEILNVVLYTFQFREVGFFYTVISNSIHHLTITCNNIPQ